MNNREIDELAHAVVERLWKNRESRLHAPDLGWQKPVEGGGKREEAGQPTSVAPPSTRLPPPFVRVADFVDHTSLKAEATRLGIDRLCDEALDHRFAAVCVNGAWVPHCVSRLKGSGVMVVGVVGFPLGAMSSSAKALEAKTLVDAGANELDVVAPVGHILDEDWDYVEDDISTVVRAAAGRAVKVILETAALQRLQIVKASALAKEAGARFVKTSTGFHPAGGASAEAVALMRAAVGDGCGVKAAGGIRDCRSALRMLAAGATRIGTSSSVSLAECLGADRHPLAELISDPVTHDKVCRLGVSSES